MQILHAFFLISQPMACHDILIVIAVQTDGKQVLEQLHAYIISARLECNDL